MSRPKRIDLPFCLYHVFPRTNSNDISFPDSRDMGKFFEYLGKYTRLFSYRIHAWRLMSNHFHLLRGAPLHFFIRMRFYRGLKGMGNSTNAM